MHRQCHFGKVRFIFKRRHCSCGYVTLQELLAKDTWPGYHHTEVFTSPRFNMWKSAILACITIPQLGLVNWQRYKFYTIL